MAGNVTELTDAAFDEIVHNSDTPVLVDFWAPWCGPCQTLKPLLEKVVESYGEKVCLAKYNVDESNEMAGKYGVMSIPSVKMVKGGEVVAEFVGIKPEAELRAWIDSQL